MAEESEVVGDSSRDILRNIQHAAKELMRTVLHCRVNAKQVEDPNTRNTELPVLVALQREKESLIREQINCTAELELRQHLAAEPLADTSVSTDQNSLDELRQSFIPKPLHQGFVSVLLRIYSVQGTGLRIRELEGELLSIRAQNYRDRQLLECLQRSEHLSKQLFSSHTTPSSNEEQLCSMVECQAGQVKELLRNLEEDGELSSEITALQGQRGEAQRSCRKLTNRLEVLQHQQNTSISEAPQAQRLQLKLGRLSHEATLLRHTLQGLIVGSGVDWAGQGEELQDLMLQLGSPFHWQQQ